MDALGSRSEDRLYLTIAVIERVTSKVIKLWYEKDTGLLIIRDDIMSVISDYRLNPEKYMKSNAGFRPYNYKKPQK
jgi:formate dehydrogenase maturation protein FdhE